MPAGSLPNAPQVLGGPHVHALTLEDQRAAERLQGVAGDLLVFAAWLENVGGAVVAADEEVFAGQGDARVALTVAELQSFIVNALAGLGVHHGEDGTGAERVEEVVVQDGRREPVSAP